MRFAYFAAPKEGPRPAGERPDTGRDGVDKPVESPDKKFDRVVETLKKERDIVLKDIDAAQKEGIEKDVLDALRKRLRALDLKTVKEGNPILAEDIRYLSDAHHEISACASALAQARREALASGVERGGRGRGDDKADAKKEAYTPLTDADFARQRHERQEAFRSAKVLDGKMRVGEKFLVNDSVNIFTRGGNLLGVIDLGKDDKGAYTRPTEVEVVNTHVRQVKAKGDLGDMKGFEDGQTVDMVAVKVHMTKERHGFSRDRTYVGWIPKSFLKPFESGASGGVSRREPLDSDTSPKKEARVQVRLADAGERRGPAGGSAGGAAADGLRDKPEVHGGDGGGGRRGGVRGDGIDLPGYHRDVERILKEGIIKDAYTWDGEAPPAHQMAQDVVVACAQNPRVFDPKFLETDVRKAMEAESVDEGGRKVFRPSDDFKRKMVRKVLDFLKEMGV